MNVQPLVSAVIPVYNGERFLAAAIESVLTQTHPAVECVVVDDGSTDASAEIAESFPGVRVVRKANGGVASARNVGVAEANGQLLAFLDADDLWLPEKLERQVAAMQAVPGAGMGYTGFWVVDEGLRRRYRLLGTPPRRRLLSAIQMEGYGLGFSFTALVDRDALAAVGGFDESLSTSADLACAWRLGRRSAVVAIPDALALYRQHGRAQMHHDMGALQHDVTAILDEVFGPDGGRRARANLHVHLAAGRARSGDHRLALDDLRLAWRLDARRIFGLPAAALARRSVRRVTGRWPLTTADVEFYSDLAPDHD